MKPQYIQGVKYFTISFNTVLDDIQGVPELMSQTIKRDSASKYEKKFLQTYPFKYWVFINISRTVCRTRAGFAGKVF